MQEEDIIEGRDDAEGRALQKGTMMQEEDIIVGGDGAEREHYKRKG